MGGLSAFLLRLVVLSLGAFVLAGGALTVAADRLSAPARKAAGPAKATTIVVPNVQGQVYVFAKGILEDGGFAWEIAGQVRGYAANVVRGQYPKPGTVVLNTGAPIVRLTLRRNPAFPERGTPEDEAPYPGTAVQFPGTR